MGREEQQPPDPGGTSPVFTNEPDHARLYQEPFRDGYTTATDEPSPLTDPATTRHGIEFDETIDMVEELDCDPTGSDPVDGTIERAAAHDRLLVFPEGTYRIQHDITIGHLRNFGIYGDGDVTFRLDPDVQCWVPYFDPIENGLFEGITIDQSAPNALAWMRFGTTTTMHVDGITITGTDDVATTDKRKWRCMLVGRDPSATLTLTDVTVTVDTITDDPSQDSGGVFITPTNRGAVTLTNCKWQRTPSIRAEESEGELQIQGGWYHSDQPDQLLVPAHATTDDVTIIDGTPDS